MKKIKRVLFVTLSFIFIFTLLCTSVFAAASAPTFPFPTPLYELTLNSPYSNLQSILVPGGSANNTQYYSLSSPYSLYTEDYLDFSSVPHLYFETPIGYCRNNSNQYLPYIVQHNFDYISGDIDYIQQSVYFDDFYGSPLFDMVLSYGQSVLPYETSNITNNGITHPCWPTYVLEYFWLGGGPPDDLELQVTVTASVLAFTYDYIDGTRGRYDFTVDPYYNSFTVSTSITSFYDEDIGFDVFKFNLYDIIGEQSMQFMIDNTFSPATPQYAVFDNIQVSLSLSGSAYDIENVFLNGFNLIDYNFNSDIQRDYFAYWPDIESCIEFFAENYPCYTIPQSVSELDFTDFLASIGSIFEVDLFGTFSLGDLLFGVVGIGMLIWFIKMFAGG